MSTLKINLRYGIFAIIFLFPLSGCALFDPFFGSEGEMAPEELMAEGMADISSGNYKAAISKFEELKDKYPYSELAITAELKMADCLFIKESYDLSYDAYDEFERMHPKDKNVPYVIYQKGQSHFQQVISKDRDQSHNLKAKDEFERLVKRFPKDVYTKKARRHIRRCLILLAEYELYVGHYYFKMKKYKAAMDRYVYLIKNYPDMGQYNEALESISRCKEKLIEIQKKEQKS